MLLIVALNKQVYQPFINPPQTSSLTLRLLIFYNGMFVIFLDKEYTSPK